MKLLHLLFLTGFACSALAQTNYNQTADCQTNQFTLLEYRPILVEDLSSPYKPLFRSHFCFSTIQLKERWILRCNVAISNAPDALVVPAGTPVTLIPDPTQHRFVRVRWKTHELILPPNSIE